MIYGIGLTYVIELKDKKIFYTGVVVEEDLISIKLKTIRGENLIISKSEILQSKQLDNSIGDKNGKD
jgi:hypothetical protein